MYDFIDDVVGISHVAGLLNFVNNLQAYTVKSKLACFCINFILLFVVLYCVVILHLVQRQRF